jgi:hypothetical protein
MFQFFKLTPILALAAAPLAAQQTRPDSGAYSATSALNYSARSILTAGATKIFASADEGSLEVPLGFKFTFYGVQYQSICLSVNGTLSFGACVASPVNEDLTSYAPKPDAPLIAAYWTDMAFNTPASDGLYYLTEGEAGKRTFTAQWNRAAICCVAGLTVNFQAVLSEETGEIAFNYVDVASADATLGNGLPATIW